MFFITEKMMKMSNQNADRLEKFKSITTEIFALTLGLGAFSLSIIPRTSIMEVAQAVGVFGIAFFYIAIIWIINSRFFEKYPLYDNTFLALNFVILFMVAISPFLMQAFSLSSDFADPMSILYALDIMGIFTILGVLHHRYILQNKEHLKAEKTREAKMDRNMQFIIALWFLISIVIPIQYRFIFWMLLPPIPPLYRHRIGPLHVK
jgi:uncharacterized membrane protein